MLHLGLGSFHRAHQARYGYAQEKNVVEIVSARVRSIGVVEKPKARRLSALSSKSFPKPHDFAETYFDRRKSRVAVYRREELRVGARLQSPCIVTEYSATTLVPAGPVSFMDQRRDLVIELERTR